MFYNADPSNVVEEATMVFEPTRASVLMARLIESMLFSQEIDVSFRVDPIPLEQNQE